MKTQDWMSENLHDHITPNIWSPSFPDLNPLGYYVWGVVELVISKHPHNALDSLRAAITKVMTHMEEDHLILKLNNWRVNFRKKRTKNDFWKISKIFYKKYTFLCSFLSRNRSNRLFFTRKTFFRKSKIFRFHSLSYIQGNVFENVKSK